MNERQTVEELVKELKKSKEDAKKDADSRVSSSFENILRNDVSGYTTVVSTKKNINCDNNIDILFI